MAQASSQGESVSRAAWRLCWPRSCAEAESSSKYAVRPRRCSAHPSSQRSPRSRQIVNACASAARARSGSRWMCASQACPTSVLAFASVSGHG
jgi:hypothetical protein